MLINNDTQEKDFNNRIGLSYDQENTIKILLEGNLKDTSYMFGFRGFMKMKIKFYKD